MNKHNAAFKRLFALLTALLLVSSMVGCAQGTSSSSDGITVTDSTGMDVSLPTSPKRVAVLFSSLADIWVSAGGTVSITVGEAVERGFADKAAILVDSGAGKTINAEALIAAQPDLVICSADIEAQVAAAELCRKAGIPAASFRVERFDDYLEVLKTFTDLTQQPDKYTLYGEKIAQEILSLKEQHCKVSSEKSILFVRAGSGSKSTKAKTAQDHFACQMLAELDTVNIADSAPVLLDGLSFEEILTQDPDYIFISTMGDPTAATAYMDSVLSQPQWQSLSAVQGGRVIYLPKDLFQYKPNARWADAYSYLINILNT